MMSDTAEAESNGASAAQYMRLLPEIMQQWHTRVTTEVSSTAKLTWSILVGAFPLIFEHVIRDVAADCSTGGNKTTLGNAHGRERALMTDHQPCDLVHEIQVFRDIVILCAEQAGLPFTVTQRHGIRCTSDEIVRDSLRGYSSVYKRAQDQFNSAVSRDLKNLLNVVSVAGQMVQQKAKDPSISSMAKRIIDKVAEADGLLQAAINPSTIKKNLKLRMIVTQVDLLRLIGNVTVEFNDASQRIRIDGDPVVGYWSWPSMENAVRRMLAYSTQFASGTGEIVVATKVEYERLILSVHSDSAFMAQEDVAGALEPDYDYSAHLGDADGLQQVQHIAESHGGSLIVESAPATGTTLLLNIPLDARPYVES